MRNTSNIINNVFLLLKLINIKYCIRYRYINQSHWKIVIANNIRQMAMVSLVILQLKTHEIT